jgi:hypothetical protein
MGTVTNTRAVIETTEYDDIRLSEWFDFDPTAGPWMAYRPPTDLFRLISWNQFPPCSFVYRRDALADVGYYDDTLPVLGDWDFNLRFFLRHRVDHLPLALAYYHHRTEARRGLANSVQGEQLHEQVRLRLLERYLRADLEQGVLGVGFLSNLLYDLRQTGSAQHAATDSLDHRLRGLEESVDRLGEQIGRLLVDRSAALNAPGPCSSASARTESGQDHRLSASERAQRLGRDLQDGARRLLSGQRRERPDPS